jgi:hypothetical protein
MAPATATAAKISASEEGVLAKRMGVRVLGQIGVWAARVGGSAVYVYVRLRAGQETA